MLDPRRTVPLAWALCLALPGCAAQHRNAVGGTVAIVGAATTVAGISIATGCFPNDNEPDDPHAWSAPPPTASHDHIDPNPSVGIPTIFIGLAVTVLGGIILGTSARTTTSSTSPPQFPPAGPSPAPTF